MTRQRVRPSLKHSIYRSCPHCRGRGLIKTEESLALEVMRNLQLACANSTIAAIGMDTTPGVSEFLNNRRRRQIADLERTTAKTIAIRGSDTLRGDEIVFNCTDAQAAPSAGTPPPSSRPWPRARRP